MGEASKRPRLTADFVGRAKQRQPAWPFGSSKPPPVSDAVEIETAIAAHWKHTCSTIPSCADIIFPGVWRQLLDRKCVDRTIADSAVG